MTPNQNTYFLATGEQGEERLTLLNEMMGETSRQLLRKAGLTPGSNVLEVGCGIGLMTHWIAEQVGTKGHVTAVDFSREQLNIAKNNTAKLNNITFLESSVFDLVGLPKFDIIYTRFLLMHLTKPFEALQIMMRFLKPGGVMVCEEASNTVACCYPRSPSCDKFYEWLMALFAKNNLDPDFGGNIYSLFQKLNFHPIFATIVQPIYTERQKYMIPLSAQELKPHLINHHIATEPEIDQIINDLKEMIKDNRYFISFLRTTQIIGFKE